MLRFARYLLVQVVAYGLDMGGFMLFFIHLGAGPLMANAVGKVLAGLFAFIVHRSFTFGLNGGDGTGKQAARYFMLLALNIPLSALVLGVLLRVIPMEVVAKFFSDVICVCFTYWLCKRFIFLKVETSSSIIAQDRGMQ